MMIYYLKTIIVILLGFGIGLTASDIDLAPVFPIRHRSAWTHGPIIPALIFFLAPVGLWGLFWLAFLPAYTIHQLRDLTPKKWAGGALIKLYPVRANLGPGLSFAWLALGAALAGYTFVLYAWPKVANYIFFWRSL